MIPAAEEVAEEEEEAVAGTEMMMGSASLYAVGKGLDLRARSIGVTLIVGKTERPQPVETLS